MKNLFKAILLLALFLIPTILNIIYHDNLLTIAPFNSHSSIVLASIIFPFFIMLVMILFFARKNKLKDIYITEGEADYKLTLEHLLIGVVVHKTDTSVLMCNKEAERVLGLPREQLIGLKFNPKEWHLINEGHSTIKLEDYPVNKVITTNKSIKGMVLGVNGPSNSNTTWLLVNANPIFTMTKKLKKVIVNFIDITSIKQTEEHLIKNEQFLYTTSKLAKVGGWELTMDGNMTWSKEMYYMHEIPMNEEITTESLTNEFFSDQRELINEGFIALFNHRKKVSIKLKLITRETKTVKWLRVIATLLLDNDGNIIKAIGATQDITTLHKFTEEKEAMAKQIQQSQKMEAIGMLAGGIAHDFNNILAGIFGYTQLAEMSMKTPLKAKEHLQMVIHGAQRATDLVQQILTFSKTNGTSPAPLKIYLVIKEAMKLLRASIPSSIKLTVDIQSKDSVKIDPTQVHQIVMNLVTNAYHAIGDEKQGEIIITTEFLTITKKELIPKVGLDVGDYIKMSVYDDGVGMTKEVQERLFDPYFSTKEEGKGTGLGLSIVHGIVTNAGGQIKVKSKLNEGTVFDIYLPISNEPSKYDNNNLLITDEELLKGTETLMIVDDELMIITAFKTILNKYGYTVDIFKDGAAGLAAFKKAPIKYNLIVTDQTMPIMTGSDMAKYILEINSDIPILLCTGHTERIAKKQWKAIGIKRVLNKPVLARDLLIAIRTILNK